MTGVLIKFFIVYFLSSLLFLAVIMSQRRASGIAISRSRSRDTKLVETERDEHFKKTMKLFIVWPLVLIRDIYLIYKNEKS